jgi:sulfotransferase
MKKFHTIAGMPRAGSTLLCNILNMNEDFHVTPTSGVIDIVKSIRANFSHNVTWKAQNRLKLMNDFQRGLNGFVNGFFEDKNVVFDKNRSWPINLSLIDEVLQNENTKIIWCYRDPVEVISSIESRYQKTILLENTDEQAVPAAFSTLDRRIGTYINGGLVDSVVEMLIDAIEMGYHKRIMIVRYHDLTNNTQAVLDDIHDFIGEPRKVYDLSQLKQNTFENDGVYNYKFMHKIKEGGVNYKKADFQLPQKYVDIINNKFAGLNKFVFEGNPDTLMGVPIEYVQEGALHIKRDN